MQMRLSQDMRLLCVAFIFISARAQLSLIFGASILCLN